MSAYPIATEIVDSSARYETNPLLLVYPASIGACRQLIIETFSTQPPLLVNDPRFVWALSVLPEEYTQADAYAVWASEPKIARDRSSIWARARETGLIVPVPATTDAIRRYHSWRRFNWDEAAVYFEATRDYPFLQMDQPGAGTIESRRMTGYRREAPPPSVYQSFPAHHSIGLTKLDPGRSVRDQLAGMDTESRRSLPGLGLLFDICFGERAKVDWADEGKFLRKSIPSGGARHPTEVFLIAFAIPGVAPGVYHYNVERHTLDGIAPGNHAAAVEHATFDLWGKFDAPPVACLVFTTLYERAMWRYREARSWRAVVIDIGHAAAVYRRVAGTLGFRSAGEQRFRDAEITGLLALDPCRQTPLFAGTLV